MNRFLSSLFLLTLPAMLFAQPRRGNPESEDFHEFRPWGIMSSSDLACKGSAGKEEFGSGVIALGDLNGDSLEDFGIRRRRCDTMFGSSVPVEWFVYHGIQGGLPSVQSGQRIGPSEPGSETTLFCAGDFDADSHRDLVARIHLYNDTSSGNHNGSDIGRLVVFWGNSSGQYNILDTTQLSCGYDLWLGILDALAHDWNNDGADELIVESSRRGFEQGDKPYIPLIHVFRGHRNQRWGNGETIRTADWTWWNAPFNAVLKLTDQDCDGQFDVALHRNETSTIGEVAVIYGRHGQLPDTNVIETISLSVANGHYSLFSDITGDGSQDLLVNCGSEERIKIYAGRPGQRLKDQYGSGLDAPIPGKGWWHRPWAEIWLPNRIHDGWFVGGFYPLYDFGDGNADSIADVWALSGSFLLCYTGRHFLDSLIDGEYDTRECGGIFGGDRLGNIDGSKVATLALATPTGVYFFKPDSRVPNFAFGSPEVPHISGEGCGSITSTARDTEELRIIKHPTLSTLSNTVKQRTP